jgi:AcrR family transcriptional regulator
MPPRPRRSQQERRSQMQKRLTKAVLECLREYGYAGTTVSQVVKRAGVSRGAHVHHYPSKAALLESAAEDLMRDAYKHLGAVMLALENADDRLQEMVQTAWRDVFNAPTNEIYLELLLASKRDSELAATLRPLALRSIEVMQHAAGHYFAVSDPNQSSQVQDHIMLTQWLLRGMALDAHLASDAQYFERFVGLWVRLLGSQIEARAVKSPPKRPRDWSEPTLTTNPPPAKPRVAAPKPRKPKA